MAGNANMHKAKKEKNDEFYTQLTDIEKELKHYKAHFKGAKVFCNCDDPKESNFWKFFTMKFGQYGLKRLVSTHYNTDGSPSYMMTMEEDRQTTVTPLEGNGDFRSEECIALLKDCDIVVTNPPFSLFREYIAQLMKHGKKFLVIGNMNAITYKEIFPLIKDEKIWLGYDHVKEFRKPDGGIQKFGNIVWYTNLDIKKRHEPLTLFRTYNEDDYPEYDNYDAIEVGRIGDIPSDYDGMMGVPITYIEKHCPEQFEIIGTTRESISPGLQTKQYERHIQHNLDGTTHNDVLTLDSSAAIKLDSIPKNETWYELNNEIYVITYKRILIRRIKTE